MENYYPQPLNFDEEKKEEKPHSSNFSFPDVMALLNQNPNEMLSAMLSKNGQGGMAQILSLLRNKKGGSEKTDITFEEF